MRPLVPLLLMVCHAVAAAAQGLPSEPITFGGGRITVGAEITATAAPDDPGFFNYTGYEYNALRNFRMGVSTEVRASDRLQVLAEVRLDQLEYVQPVAFYLRIRPWPTRRFDIQAGRIPPTFGATTRRTYGAGNPLIGQPLAYQYLTSLRPDAIPATADDLLRMRGRGWQASYPLGDGTPAPGVPLVDAFHWDTGVQVHGEWGVTEWAGAVTTGTLSNPRIGDDNDGRQVAGRLVVHATPGLALGISGASGAFLSSRLETDTPGGLDVGAGTQRALGVDAEYSTGRFLTRVEGIWSRWRLPARDPGLDHPLDALSVLVEARYRLAPGVHAAVRAERLGFSRIPGSEGWQPWDAAVRRLEVGGGFSIRRNVLLKAAWQIDRRDGGRVDRLSLGAVQLVYWF